MSEKTIKANVTVLLSSGHQQVHKYDLAFTDESSKEWTKSTIKPIVESLWSETPRTFSLTNPRTMYNSKHVASVSFEYADAEEYEKMLADVAPKSMGFGQETGS